jgi:hypothetical protein
MQPVAHHFQRNSRCARRIQPVIREHETNVINQKTCNHYNRHARHLLIRSITTITNSPCNLLFLAPTPFSLLRRNRRWRADFGGDGVSALTCRSPWASEELRHRSSGGRAAAVRVLIWEESWWCLRFCSMGRALSDLLVRWTDTYSFRYVSASRSRPIYLRVPEPPPCESARSVFCARVANQNAPTFIAPNRSVPRLRRAPEALQGQWELLLLEFSCWPMGYVSARPTAKSSGIRP